MSLFLIDSSNPLSLSLSRVRSVADTFLVRGYVGAGAAVCVTDRLRREAQIISSEFTSFL
jgi:hypothetical protein